MHVAYQLGTTQDKANKLYRSPDMIANGEGINNQAIKPSKPVELGSVNHFSS